MVSVFWVTIRFPTELTEGNTVSQILVSWSADHFNSRGYHCAGAAFVGAIAFLVSAVLPPDNYGGRYATLVIGSAGAFACVPPMLGWLSSNIWTTASTGLAIAINVSIGAGLGQIPGVWIYKADEAKKGYPTGHGVNCAMLFVVTIGAIGLSIFYQRKNKRIQSSMVEGDEVRLYKL